MTTCCVVLLPEISISSVWDWDINKSYPLIRLIYPISAADHVLNPEECSIFHVALQFRAVYLAGMNMSEF
jgi:hypothetical protein